MPERSRRIIESAIQLADKGGFQAVRLRDVASHSGVALGTLYTRFKSKEDILVAALEDEVQKLELLLSQYPPPGETELDRVVYLFTVASRALFSRQNFARAVLRSVASGEPEVAEKVLRFHRTVTALVIMALRGDDKPKALDFEGHPSEGPMEVRLGFLLQEIWFANLVGWMGGLTSEDQVIAVMKQSASLLLAGRDALGEG